MKRFVLAIALTGLLSVTALAGEIPINGATAPPPPPPAATTSNTTSTTSSTLLVTVILTVLGLR